MLELQVVGAIIIQNNQVLCALRGPGRNLADLWEFPGGKIKTGETAEMALRREIKEELLTEVIVGDAFMTTRYEYDFGVVNLTTFICHLTGPEPKLTEHLEQRWVRKEHLEQLKWAPADQPTVDALSHLAKLPEVNDDK